MLNGNMNQICKVCGEPAAGFHFGAFTCEGCKSFFGRTYNNIAAISGCKNSGDCVINKKNRTTCKACRLRKCLLVGMSKSGSRYGRRSNWFKIHCLLQGQQTPSAIASSDNESKHSIQQLVQMQRESMQAKGGAYQTSQPGSCQHINVIAKQSVTKRNSNACHTWNASAADEICSLSDIGDDCEQRNGSLEHAAVMQKFSNNVAAGQDRVLQIFRSQSEPLRSPCFPFVIANISTPVAIMQRYNNFDVIAHNANASTDRVPAIEEQPIDLSKNSNRNLPYRTAHVKLSSISPPLDLTFENKN